MANTASSAAENVSEPKSEAHHQKALDDHVDADNKALHAGIMRKVRRQAFKDYVFFPLITFPVAPIVLAGNVGANLIRNLWSSTVIFCGHFTQDAETFTEAFERNLKAQPQNTH